MNLCIFLGAFLTLAGATHTLFKKKKKRNTSNFKDKKLFSATRYVLPSFIYIYWEYNEKNVIIFYEVKVFSQDLCSNSNVIYYTPNTFGKKYSLLSSWSLEKVYFKNCTNLLVKFFFLFFNWLKFVRSRRYHGILHKKKL